MSVTYGFYNSIKGDRKYNALETVSYTHLDVYKRQGREEGLR